MHIFFNFLQQFIKLKYQPKNLRYPSETLEKFGLSQDRILRCFGLGLVLSGFDYQTVFLNRQFCSS